MEGYIVELNGYGFFNEIDVFVGKYRVVVENKGEYYRYTRFLDKDIMVDKEIYRCLRFELIPLYPVFVPENITRFIEIEFDNSIIVPSNDTVEIYVKIPVDIGIYVYDKYRKYELVDVFDVNKIDYSLYGSVVEGLLARYYRSRIYTDIVDSELGEAVSFIKIINRHENIVEVKRIVLDSQILKMYYKTGTWKAYTQKIYMNIIARDKAIITYGEPFIEDVVPINDPEGFKPPRIRTSNEMLWGLK